MHLLILIKNVQKIQKNVFLLIFIIYLKVNFWVIFDWLKLTKNHDSHWFFLLIFDNFGKLSIEKKFSHHDAVKIHVMLSNFFPSEK